MDTPLTIKRIHHVEFIVGNALQAAYFYRKTFGFNQTGYLGPETGHPGCASYVLEQDRIRLVFTTPLSHEDPRNVFLLLHSDGVKDISFEVDDVDASYQEAVRRGAASALAPKDLQDENGRVRVAAVRTFGDVIHTFVSTRGFKGSFLPGYHPTQVEGEDLGFTRIDHIVANVEDRQMDRWCDYYARVFGFHQFVSYDDKDISTEFSALRSKVMANETRNIKLPINEPAAGKNKSQIQEYIDFNYSAGVQHIALYTPDILTTVRKLRKNGINFLTIPKSYYDGVWDRVGDIKEDREQIRKHNILVDRDENGYLLQIFTKPVQNRPTLFLEVIQRAGCESFGKGNFKALFQSIELEQKRRGNL
ncbi:4-hydroxyphenylpyruvate dioxygenase [Desulfopila sp. IMCC35006]|uniref:4-hydroxyphenylpyruvate dioxygenase n=1 Tax=Desulfopila sp. IMCC35006 TaxID=2569542 RepID=UPI0010AC9FA8|nr:4-hydroxyphenylpyruvate dioxygenase [Desulfopila sp. IMCC35006]TKB25130.1 4-hydroxyphenylpyruvate dioxygenase [Desulfopila sp. IMCC35006]